MVGFPHLCWVTGGWFSSKHTTGWWFGTCLWPSIYWEEYSQLIHIFQRGRSTTNQIYSIYNPYNPYKSQLFMGKKKAWTIKRIDFKQSNMEIEPSDIGISPSEIGMAPINNGVCVCVCGNGVYPQLWQSFTRKKDDLCINLQHPIRRQTHMVPLKRWHWFSRACITQNLLHGCWYTLW